jgi:hypothetical protein
MALVPLAVVSRVVGRVRPITALDLPQAKLRAETASAREMALAVRMATVLAPVARLPSRAHLEVGPRRALLNSQAATARAARNNPGLRIRRMPNQQSKVPNLQWCLPSSPCRTTRGHTPAMVTALRPMA